MFYQMSEPYGPDKLTHIMNHHTFEPIRRKWPFAIVSSFNSDSYPLRLMIDLCLRKERNDGHGWRGKGEKNSLVNIH